jgi:tetratricopeptide (TPR) repeat protein
MYVIPTWLNWLIFLTYLTAVVYFFFKDKKIFFALGFIFLAAVASMTPIKVSWLVAERYIFLGSLGFCLFLVLFLKRFVCKKTEPILFILFLVVLGGCGYRIIMRNIDWQTNHNLWVNTCKVSPNSHNAWNNIGDDYDKLAQLETTNEGKIKQYENSIKGFTQSTIIKPNYADAFHNRANIFYKMGRFDLARDSYETGLSFNPGMYQSYMSLLQIDFVEKRFDLAMSDLSKLQKIKPNDLQVAYITAVVYANVGKIDDAKKVLNSILNSVPDFQQAKDLLKQLGG